MKHISEILIEAKEYADRYPCSDDVKEAVFHQHLVYLLNQLYKKAVA